MKDRLVTPTVEWSMLLPANLPAPKAPKGPAKPPTLGDGPAETAPVVREKVPVEVKAVVRDVLEAFWFVAQVTRNNEGGTDSILATHPKVVTRGAKRYLSIRWGGRYLSTPHRQKLQKLDPRFHDCPPLRKDDDGMAACKE